MGVGTVFLLVVLIFFAWVILIYNHLVQLRENVKNGWAQIDVQLKRRHDLIPNLVEAAKAYMQHERETFEQVTRARQSAVEARSFKDIQESEGALSAMLGRLMVVMENYPQLKADRQMMRLHEEFVSTENKIAFARQYFNDEVNRLNTAIQMFPNNLVAGFFHFEERRFFQVKNAVEKESPRVKF